MSDPEALYGRLATDEGRATFWAESAIRRGDRIEFRFPNGMTWSGRVLAEEPPRRFGVEYLGGTRTTFVLEPDGAGGTDLTLTDEHVAPEHREDVSAGWVSVLLALKAAADHGIDLRSHDADRTWDQGFVDN